MAEEIEIEFKTLINEEDFERLRTKLPFFEKPIIQTNYYFDTIDYSLKRQPCALRIREKENNYTLTLKQPHQDGILETHDKLTKKEFTQWIHGQPVCKPYTGKQLRSMGIHISGLHFFGSLQTKRHFFKDHDIEYVLDQSFYFDIVDYELEVEAPSYPLGLTAFNSLLQTFNIQKQKPISKNERFFQALQIRK